MADWVNAVHTRDLSLRCLSNLNPNLLPRLLYSPQCVPALPLGMSAKAKVSQVKNYSKQKASARRVELRLRVDWKIYVRRNMKNGPLLLGIKKLRAKIGTEQKGSESIASKVKPHCLMILSTRKSI